MKKILFTLAAILLTISINAQDFKHYSLDEVNGDTVQYLQKNFIDQKAYFIGKPFSKVMEIYLQDLPLNYSATSTTTPWENPKDATEYIMGISITWLTEEEGQYYSDNHIKKISDLDILFEPPYNESDDDAYEIYDTDEKMVNHLKNYIVKEIKLL
ncbi:MAG: hypothetical protein J6M37_04395 [Prevotella sp.]|nr:hypothetical protein [Prevotella sp.]